MTRERKLPNPFTRKLELFAPLSERDKQLLGRMCERSRLVDADQEITRQGSVPESVHVVLEGFGCRYKILPDGDRSIIAYLIPGDVCDLHMFILGLADHSVAILSPCRILDIPRGTIDEILEKNSPLSRALWWTTLLDEAILRETIVNIARRSAITAIAHLFCELLFRLEAVGLGIDDGFAFPVTQSQLADHVGLSTVHVNRTLQSLRKKGLIRLQGKSLHILNLEKLRELAGFEPTYLHLKSRPSNRVSQASSAA
jgi:CRP-like cAMP-binding protein